MVLKRSSPAQLLQRGEIRGTAVFSLILSGMKGAAYFRARIHIRIKLLALSHFLTLLFCLILEAKCKV